jgi:hypothetical protein
LAAERRSRRHPKVTAEWSFSSHLFSPIPHAIERLKDLPEFADLYCTPSAT